MYEDEVTFYRHPTQGTLWSFKGRSQPRMHFSHKSNTRTRVMGVFDATTGALHCTQRSKIDRRTYGKFLFEVAKSYPEAKKIYVIMDNWSVHFHEDAMRIIGKDVRIELVPLPTYSPWLNHIEKVWRYVKQTIIHNHPYADDFDKFKSVIDELLNSFKSGSPMLLKYTGLVV